MASPTKILETIRGRKRNKRLVARTKRIRRQAQKTASTTPDALRRFVAGAAKRGPGKAAAPKAAVTKSSSAKSSKTA